MSRHAIMLRTGNVGPVEVDREAGVVRNVAVITAGTTKVSATGIGPFDIDAVTLQQVADAINASPIGVKSRMTHPEVEGRDDLPCRLGYVRNARVVGDAVRADMHFHNAASNEAIVIMAIAEADPESCGISIVDEDAQLEPANTPTGLVLRVQGLDAADWVGEPAANPAGMLSATRKTRVQMQKGIEAMLNQAQIDYLKGLGLPEDATAEAIVAYVEGLTPEQKAALESLATVETPAETPAADPVAMEGEMTEEEKKVAASKGKVAASAAKPVNVAAVVQAALKAERSRVTEIRTIALKCGFDSAWADKQINDGADINTVRQVALANLKRSPKDMQTSSISVGEDRNRESLPDAVRDAILLRAGVRSFVKTDSTGGVALSANGRPELRQPHARASEFRGHSIWEIGRRYLIACGYQAAYNLEKAALCRLIMSRSKLAAAMPGIYMAHGTGDFPYILEDSMGKSLRQAYQLAPHTWKLWCRQVTAPDFKTIKRLQLSEAGNMVDIPEGDDYTFTTLTEGRETYSLTKRGLGLKFTWEMLVNDDLDAFSRGPQILGNAAARAVESAAIGVLTTNATLSDSVALFATAHANLTTGALTVTSLGAARAAMRKQTALGSTDPLELMPAFLIVPEALSVTAQQLVSSTVDPAKSNATPNPFANQLQVIPSPRLDSTSATQWYLAADTNAIDTVEVAFLEGEETPVVEEENEFDSDCRKIKIRHSSKAKAIDYRGLVRSSGA